MSNANVDETDPDTARGRDRPAGQASGTPFERPERPNAVAEGGTRRGPPPEPVGADAERRRSSRNRCTSCDRALPSDASYCRFCGAALTRTERATQSLVAELAVARLEADEDRLDHRPSTDRADLGYDEPIEDARRRIERWLEEVGLDV